MKSVVSFLLSASLVVAVSGGAAAAVDLVQGSRVHVTGDQFAADLALRDGFVAAVQSSGGTVYSYGEDGTEAAFVELPSEVGDQDLVLVCIGMVDSFRGDGYLERFRNRLDSIIDGLPANRVALVTPVPLEIEVHEDPTTALNHAVVVGRYADVIIEVAARRACLLVDLHGPLSMAQDRLESGGLLHDGMHLNAIGWQLAEADLLWQLGLSPQDPDLAVNTVVLSGIATPMSPSRELDMLHGKVPLGVLSEPMAGLPPSRSIRSVPSWDEAKRALHDLGSVDQPDPAAVRRVMDLLVASPHRSQDALEIILPYAGDDQPEAVRLAALAAIDDLSLESKMVLPGIKTIRIGVVPVKMTYDPARFEVVAGEPVRIILSNSDAQPHNLLVCAPGSLRAIGRASEAMGTTAEAKSKHWVPESPKVLHAMPMVQLGEEGELRFMAPQRPGRYPIICTYPGHWRMMNGVMTVRRITD
jgi:uncharacterized cupredoxin-like copper-binding protein